MKTQAVSAAIEVNLFELYRYWGNSSSVKAELHESPHLTWFMTGVAHPFMNGVFKAQLSSENTNVIENTLAYFREHHLPFIWWTGVTPQQSNLETHLEAHGLVDTGGTPGMAIDLLNLSEDLPALDALTIQPVEDPDALEQWVHTLCAGFHVPQQSKQVCFDLFTNLGFDWPLRNYVGWFEDRPVAASSLFLGENAAGIYCVTVLPEVRRQGIGSRITLAPLRDARAQGYRIAVLHSSDMGFGMYRKLGFQEHCTLRSRVWRGEPNQ